MKWARLTTEATSGRWSSGAVAGQGANGQGDGSAGTWIAQAASRMDPEVSVKDPGFKGRTGSGVHG